MKIIKVITVIAIHEYHLNYYMKIIFTRLIIEVQCQVVLVNPKTNDK